MERLRVEDLEEDLEIEYLFEPPSQAGEHDPVLVFLHEGLGSVELWRSFPSMVRDAMGGPGMLVYSRPGYGRSRPYRETRSVGYMHEEAVEVLPRVLSALGIERPVLVGHSDGASIAIIHAGSGFAVSALVLIAAHVFVEERTIAGIEAARAAYLGTDLADRMLRYHENPDATFWGWNRVWLSKEFREWNIEEYLPEITCPVLAIQGSQDEYGTVAQLDAIERAVRGPFERLVLAGAGHAPHQERFEEVVKAVSTFLTGIESFDSQGHTRG
ncbi:MAG: alpha/beta hydrolase [Actinobacteria bacterium]|nr:alpha/beta hydrolase [Actinomycetota bacterium]